MNPRPGAERRTDPRRRSLELARTDILRRLDGAASGPHRTMLERALADLDTRLREMRTPEPSQE